MCCSLLLNKVWNTPKHSHVARKENFLQLYGKSFSMIFAPSLGGNEKGRVRFGWS